MDLNGTMGTTEQQLSRDVIGKRISGFVDIDADWALEAKSHYYQLDLKMTNLSALKYGFTWNTKDNKAPSASAIDLPWRVVVINLSMNEFVRLETSGLEPFTQLRSIEASLNSLENLSGVEVCGELRRLVVSHNALSKLDGLHGCRKLVYLDLSVNLFTNLTLMPNLSSLTTLNVNDNKIKDLDGIHALPNLAELRAQKNYVTNTIPLAGCLKLKIVDLGYNEIRSLRLTMESISGLPQLQSLTLKGNPIAQDREYKKSLTDSARALLTLDHILVRDGMDRPPSQHPGPIPGMNLAPGSLGNQLGMKDAARRTFIEQIADRKRLKETTVAFLHKKIREIEKEYEEYELSMQMELDSAIRYLDSLGPDGLKDYDMNRLQNTWPWANPHGLGQRRPDLHPMYDLLRNFPQGTSDNDQDMPKPSTDQLLLDASNKLAKGRPR